MENDCLLFSATSSNLQTVRHFIAYAIYFKLTKTDN